MIEGERVITGVIAVLLDFFDVVLSEHWRCVAHAGQCQNADDRIVGIFFLVVFG